MRKKKLYERIAQLCEVEGDVVAPLPVLVVRGEHEVEMEGCCGILEYGPDRVVLKSAGGRVTVAGSKLLLSDFRDGVLYVRGNIRGIVLGDGEEKKC